MAARSEETRRRILGTALELFRDAGFEKATMREIAAQAGVATGLAYYYFKSKEDLVMAFYHQAVDEMAPLLDAAHSSHPKLEPRLRAIIEAKLEYFAPNRAFLGALLGRAADPAHPLSPFSAETRAIRENDWRHFQRALEETKTKVPADLAPVLPKILWLYQMGLILFWIYDRSNAQARTHLLLEKSLGLVVTGIKLSSLPLMGPVRKLILELIEIIEPAS